METTLGTDADDVLTKLTKNGITRSTAKKALELAQQKGIFTIFSVVDALTRLAQDLPNAGDRLEADQEASRLLQLVA